MKLSEFCNNVKCIHFTLSNKSSRKFNCVVKSNYSVSGGSWAEESRNELFTIMHPEKLSDPNWVSRCKYYSKMKLLAKLNRI